MGVKMLPHEVKQDIMGRLITYGLGVPTLAMTWLNDNSSGVQAGCTLVVTLIMVYRLLFVDLKKNRQPTSEK